jgi:hypothetical protein
VQQLPHWFHAATSAVTLLVELVLVWMLFLPQRFRIVCFCVVTAVQIGIILTANYAFLNYLVLALGVLLLNDLVLIKCLPRRSARAVREELIDRAAAKQPVLVARDLLANSPTGPGVEREGLETGSLKPIAGGSDTWSRRAHEVLSAAGLWLRAFCLSWLLYASFYLVVEQLFRTVPLLPWQPVSLLEPFRIANSYGLFGRMTWKRYEIEFQGSNDGTNWIVYPFCNKPQSPAEAPRIYAPYQPRFDWNMWFASLGYWRENQWVLLVEERLLSNEPNVVDLFAGNPFPDGPPKQVRAVLWQYWFTNRATKQATGVWWRREFRGLYAPALERGPDDKFLVTEWPGTLPTPP